MQYLCVKQLTVGGVAYHPGDIIPDGVILPERSRKLLNSGCISEIGQGNKAQDESKALYTSEEVDRMIAEAIDEAVDNTVMEMKKEQEDVQLYTARLDETAFGAYDRVVSIAVKGTSDEQFMAVPAKPEEIRQVFDILQMNADEGVRAIADVKSENVLILIHAAESRKTVKNAAKEQADKLFSPKDVSNAPRSGNEASGTNTEGVDT